MLACTEIMINCGNLRKVLDIISEKLSMGNSVIWKLFGWCSGNRDSLCPFL